MESSPTSRPVVVVDDNPDDLFFFRRCVAKSNVANPLAVARDGAEAIAVLKTLAPAGAPEAAQPQGPLIVFLDLKLPRRSGFEVLEWIRSERAFDAVPVAILSSSAEPRDVSRAYALGAQSYLVKRPTPDDMTAAIAAAATVRIASDLATVKLPGLARPPS